MAVPGFREFGIKAFRFLIELDSQKRQVSPLVAMQLQDRTVMHHTELLVLCSRHSIAALLRH